MFRVIDYMVIWIVASAFNPLPSAHSAGREQQEEISSGKPQK